MQRILGAGQRQVAGLRRRMSPRAPGLGLMRDQLALRTWSVRWSPAMDGNAATGKGTNAGVLTVLMEERRLRPLRAASDVGNHAVVSTPAGGPPAAPRGNRQMRPAWRRSWRPPVALSEITTTAKPCIAAPPRPPPPRPIPPPASPGPLHLRGQFRAHLPIGEPHGHIDPSAWPYDLAHRRPCPSWPPRTTHFPAHGLQPGCR